jgi:hypothetical protein
MNEINEIDQITKMTDIKIKDLTPSFICGGEGDGIFRRGGGTDSKFELRSSDEVRRKREKNNFRR